MSKLNLCYLRVFRGLSSMATYIYRNLSSMATFYILIDMCIDELGVFHANQTSMCLDPQGEVGAVKPV